MIELKCKSCGAILHIDLDQPCIICDHCNAEYLRDDELVQELFKRHLAMQNIKAQLETATKQDNYAMQYRCLKLLNSQSEPLDDYQLVLLDFYNCLIGKTIDTRFLDSLSKEYCDKLLAILDNLPDSFNLDNKPISKLAVEHFLMAYKNNNYSNPYRDNASMAKTKTHKRKQVKLYLILSAIIALALFWVLYYNSLALQPSFLIALATGLFTLFVCFILTTTTPLMHTPCQSPGLPRGSMLYVYQDGFVIVRNNKPDVFLFQGIQQVFLQASGVLTLILANQMTSVTVQLPDLDAVDIQKLITFANTKIKALEANYFD